MAYHYHANQFEEAYKPTYLRNWEVPKSYHDYPKGRKGKTKVIANDRGHILPDCPRSSKNPWENYTGTWSLPLKIDRKTADELNGSRARKKLTCKERRELEDPQKDSEIKHQEIDKNTEEEAVRKSESPEKLIAASEEKQPREELTVDQPQDSINKENIENNASARPYVPGDFTEEKHRPSSYQQLLKNRYAAKTPLKTSCSGYPRNREDFTKSEEHNVEKDMSRDVEQFYRQHKDMVQAQPASVHSEKKEHENKRRLLSPILAAISNFSVAKKLHRENLEHEPLPDSITDALYRKLQMQRNQDTDPGLALKNGNYATGVGWKAYPGYSPTRCTKLKVYRPKTCVQNKIIEKGERPCSVSSFDKKWRFIRQRKVTPIQLAICWDLTPEDKKDEPMPPTHIDGSNGSLAPAVFTLVHSPKENAPKEENGDSRKSSLTEKQCDGIHGCGSLFEHRAGEAEKPTKDFFFHRPKTSKNSSHSSDHSNKSNEEHLNKKRSKSAHDLHKIKSDLNKNCLSDDSSVCKPKFHQSTPNIAKCCECKCAAKAYNDHKRSNKRQIRPRLCVACEVKNFVSNKEKQAKNEFKMAFKAGIPQNNIVSRNQVNKIKIPRQIDPYCYKKYEINSLAPPFSLQKNYNQTYPDHWRLATVYQHSYKPLQARKKPLITTIFN